MIDFNIYKRKWYNSICPIRQHYIFWDLFGIHSIHYSFKQVWQQYAQQKHDLFIDDRSTAGYLTANPGVAGYLTTTQKAAPIAPPPMTDMSTSSSGMHNDSLIWYFQEILWLHEFKSSFLFTPYFRPINQKEYTSCV